ncbi:MAG: DUF1326 domain-containing protein [Alphaproteobacteria bacterium]
MAEPDPWWASGLLYENCNCQLLCPAHVSFKHNCDNETCLGFWGVHVNKGRFAQLTLQEQDAVVLYQSPQLMHTENSWTLKLFFDQDTDEEQRNALEQILTGEVGGPWRILAKFVADRLETQVVPIHFKDDGKRIDLRIEGILQSLIESVESKRSGQPATLANLFNVIHAKSQLLATGSSFVQDQDFQWTTERKHALFSEFSWMGP